VTLAGVVLFLHITAAIVAFSMAAVLHAALHAGVRARDVREMRTWARLVHLLDPLFPVVALLLVGLGGWLIHLSGGEFRWSDGWVVTALVTLVVLEALAGVLIAPKAKLLVREVEKAADGPMPAKLRELTRDAGIWYVAHAATFGFMGIVFLMAAKPNGLWSPIVVAVGISVGLLLARAQRKAFPSEATVTSSRPHLSGVPASETSLG
jgi:uncharacterized membrane protein